MLEGIGTGNPAAEGTSYFFINKISNIQSFIVLRWKKCVKLVNEHFFDNFLDDIQMPRLRPEKWYHIWPDRPTGTHRVNFQRFPLFSKFLWTFRSRGFFLLLNL